MDFLIPYGTDTTQIQMANNRRMAFLVMLGVFIVLGVGCGSEEAELPTSTPKPNLLESAKEAVDTAGEDIGDAVSQAAGEAQTILNDVGDTAKETAGQVGDALDTAGTAVADQGGELVDAVGAAGQSTAEALQERIASLKPDEDGN